MVCILRNSNGDESGEKGVGGDCGQVEDRAAYIKYLFFQMFFYVTKMGLHGSTFFTIAISVERYLGVQFPFESVRQTRGLLFYALPVIVLTAMVSLPDIYVKTIKPKPEKTCSVDANAPTLGHRTSYKYTMDDDNAKMIRTDINAQFWVSIFNIVFTIGIPLIVLIFCNGKIFLKLRATSLEMKPSRNTSNHLQQSISISRSRPPSPSTSGMLMAPQHFGRFQDGHRDCQISSGLISKSTFQDSVRSVASNGGSVRNGPSAGRVTPNGNSVSGGCGTPRGGSQSSPTSSSNNPTTSPSSSERNLSVVLFAIVAVFLTCHLGRIVTSLTYPSDVEKIEICSKVGQIYKTHLVPERKSTWQYIIVPITHLMLMVNSSVNFIIYCAVGSKFRTALTQHTLGHRMSSRKNRQMGTSPNGTNGQQDEPSTYSQQRWNSSRFFRNGFSLRQGRISQLRAGSQRGGSAEDCINKNRHLLHQSFRSYHQPSNSGHHSPGQQTLIRDQSILFRANR